ncbi:hypothetical protein [Dactylosporangium sp. NPDC049140]|uniref:hypothetical protein n=1 Tax=Dactylosporangium sp. NPDC049140 TaxID=3155647 RepID=UPI0033CE213B
MNRRDPAAGTARLRQLTTAGLAPVQRTLYDTVIEAIGSGGRPDFESAEEASAHDLPRQLVGGPQMDDATYARAAGELGDEGLADMVLLIGL